MKVFKILLVGVLAFCTLFSTPGMVSKAANTGDKVISTNIQKSGSDTKFVYTNGYVKYNSTKVYVYLTTTPYRYVQVITESDGSSSGVKYTNETVGKAVVEKGVKCSVTNNCFEHRPTGAQTVLVRLGLKSEDSAGYVYGVWSPDSSKNYTIVN